jgi:ribonuclease HI
MASEVKEIIVYCDGGASNNPGRAGIGVLIRFNHQVKEYAKEIGEATNNQAEYSALIFALEKIKHLFGKEKIKNLKIILNSDSELVVSQINNKYKILEPELVNYFIKFHNLTLDFGQIEVKLIPREENLAHKLVEKALHNFSTLI